MTLTTSLLPLICLGVMVKSNLEGEPLITALAALCCYTSARSALLLLRISAQGPPRDTPK